MSAANNLNSRYLVDLDEKRVTGTMTLYAGWEANNSPSPSPEIEKVTVTFLANALDVPEVQQVKKGDQASKITDPKRDGFTFAGWYYGTTKESEPFTWKDKITENTIIYAVWDVNAENADKIVQTKVNTEGVSNLKEVVIYPPTAVEEELVQVAVTAVAGYRSNKPVITYQLTSEGAPQTVPAEAIAGEDGVYTFAVPAGMSGATFTVTPVIEVAEHTVSVSATEHGTVTVSKEKALYKDQISVTATPDIGYNLESLKVTADEEVIFSVEAKDTQTFEFIMPDDNVTVTANFVPTGEPLYEITKDEILTGGHLDILPGTSITENTVVTLQPVADTGYEIAKVSYQPENGTEMILTPVENVYSFTMPAKPVKVNAEFAKQSYQVTFVTSGGSAVENQNVLYDEKVIKPEDPKNEGFVFGGWYTDEDLTTEYDFTKSVAGPFTLYAKWIAGNTTVTFHTNGGNAIDPQLVAYGQSAEKPADPAKEGNTFGGWFADLNFATPYTFEEKVMEPTIVYAKWNPVTQTVTFQTNGGTPSPSAQSIAYGEAAIKPNDPVKAGFAFQGWYTDQALTKAYDFKEAVKSDLTLYAKWNEVFTVVFDANGGKFGTDVTKSVTYEKDQVIGAKTPVEPVQAGYVFEGWYTTKAAADALTAASKVNPATEKIAKAMTFYAGWSKEPVEKQSEKK